MSNLTTAKAQIEAEIEDLHARIAVLQQTLAALSGILELTEKTPVKLPKKAAPAKRGPKPKVVAAPKVADSKAKKAPKASKPTKAKQAGELPFTGGDYWPNLVTGQQQSGADIVNAAINGLGFAATKQQVQKLQQRATFALNALVKSGQIKDSGKGRERRFFKG